MINSQNLIDKICCALTTGGLTPVQCCSAQNALTILCQPVYSVATCANLPNATTYNGRMVYVISEAIYYYAVQGVWDANFSSVPHAVTSLTCSWGYNSLGSLGDGTITNRSSPVSVIGGFIDWCQIASQRQSLAVRQNGTAWAWGRANYGILGDNTTVNKSSPVSVIGGFTDWCQVAAGTNHSLGVRTNGTAWAWGVKDSGKLGDNDMAANKSSPVSVVGGFTDWCQIAAGWNHSLAVRTNGTAWTWGPGGQGRLGDNSATDRSSPVSVVGGFTDWCQVSGGNGHSLGLRTNGTIYAWGYNLFGQLGNNTIVSTSSPVSVIGGFTDWCQVSSGYNHSLGVRQTGTAWAWGCNGYGQLGDNTTASKSSPVSVVGGYTDWCQVSVNTQHTLGVRTNGTAWAWGAGGDGRLGDNTTVNKSSPVSVIGGFTDWCQVSAGYKFSLGARTNGTAWAWGYNTCGVLGDNTTVSKSSPVSVVGGFTDWWDISAGSIHSLAIRKSCGF
jgi:alpha-tubulin suppressor-like RCC1 family protein